MPYKDVFPRMQIVVKYEGKRFLGKILQERYGDHVVRYLSIAFGVNIPQQSEEGEDV